MLIVTVNNWVVDNMDSCGLLYSLFAPLIIFPHISLYHRRVGGGGIIIEVDKLIEICWPFLLSKNLALSFICSIESSLVIIVAGLEELMNAEEVFLSQGIVNTVILPKYSLQTHSSIICLLFANYFLGCPIINNHLISDIVLFHRISVSTDQ